MKFSSARPRGSSAGLRGRPDAVDGCCAHALPQAPDIDEAVLSRSPIRIGAGTGLRRFRASPAEGPERGKQNYVDERIQNKLLNYWLAVLVHQCVVSATSSSTR